MDQWRRLRSGTMVGQRDVIVWSASLSHSLFVCGFFSFPFSLLYTFSTMVDTDRQPRRRYFGGVCALIAVVFIWVSSSFAMNVRTPMIRRATNMLFQHAHWILYRAYLAIKNTTSRFLLPISTPPPSPVIYCRFSL